MRLKAGGLSKSHERRPDLKAAPNYRIIALIVAFAFFMVGLDGAIINTSMPQMAHTFGVAPVAMSLGVTAYLLAMVSLIPLSGWIADRWGARNVFAVAVILFAVASVACGLATSLPMFAVARVFQGIGGALMTPVGRLVILRHTERSQLLQATALVTWPGLLAPVLGPAIGGFITTYIGWRWNFLLNLPLGVLGAVLVTVFVPNSLGDRRPLDIPGALLSAAALVGTLYGLQSFAHGGLPAWASGGLIAGGVVAGLVGVRHFSRTEHPLLDLSSLKVLTFSAAYMQEGLAMRIAISTAPFLLPLMFQVGFGRNAFQSGLLLLTYFGGNLLMKTVTTPLLQWFGFRRVIVVDGLFAGLSLFACALLQTDTPLPLMVGVLVAAGMTRSMQYSALSTIAFGDITEKQRSSAAALSSVMGEGSMAAGIAIAALGLSLSQTARGGSTLAIADFRMALGVSGVIALASAMAFLRLPADAGAEISGHGRRRQRPI